MNSHHTLSLRHGVAPFCQAVEESTPADAEEVVSALFEAMDAGGPEFNAAYAELIGYARANCGFGELGITASEYAFGGLPSSVPAGPTIVTLENTGEEYHEIIVQRVNTTSPRRSMSCSPCRKRT